MNETRKGRDPATVAYMSWAAAVLLRGEKLHRPRGAVFNAGWHARDAQIALLQSRLTEYESEGFRNGWRARDEEVARERARAEAAEGRVREMQRRINESQRPETIADAIHEGAWDRGRRRGLREAQIIVEEVAGADPPTPTGEASDG